MWRKARTCVGASCPLANSSVLLRDELSSIPLSARTRHLSSFASLPSQCFSQSTPGCHKRAFHSSSVMKDKWSWLWGGKKEEEAKQAETKKEEGEEEEETVADRLTTEKEPVQIDLDDVEEAARPEIKGSRWAPILELPIESLNGEEGYLGMVRLNPNLFLESIRTDILNRVVVWQLAARRAGTHKTKNRAEVRGGGRKPHPQKGTGRARAGSIRSPIWRGGGHAHAIRPRSYWYPLQLNIQRMGLRVALSVKYAQGKLRIIKNTEIARPKTKVLVTELKKKNWANVLIVDGKEKREDFSRASGNLGSTKVVSEEGLNVYDILSHDLLVLTLESLEYLEKALLRSKHYFYEFPLLPGAPTEEGNLAAPQQQQQQQQQQLQ